MSKRVAVAPHTRPYRGIPIGKTFYVSPREAELLVRIRRVRVVEATASTPVPETPPDPAPEISARTGKPKRKYRRRDMRAEG